MTPDKPIVVATDLTARSDRPFARAVDIARARNSGLALVHVIEGRSRAEESRLAEQAERAIERLTRGLTVPVTVRLAYGSAPEVIAAMSADLDAAAIVVGAARYNHVSDFFLGTAVDHLVRHAAMPVLVVKERPAGPYDHLLVGTDFSDNSIRALLAAADLFPQVPITLVHAYDRVMPHRLGEDISSEVAGQWAEDAMAKFLAQPALDPLRGRLSVRSIEATVPKAMSQAAEGAGEPLAVIGTHGLSASAQILLGSQASELLAAIPLDVLIVRNEVAGG